MGQKNREPNESSEQSVKFVTAARAAECDEGEKAFEGKLRRIAKADPKEKPKKKP